MINNNAKTFPSQNDVNEWQKKFGVKNLSTQMDVDDIVKENADANTLLKQAIKSKEITEQQAVLLEKQYKDHPAKLLDLLKEFKQMRINYLMSMAWEDLDKQGLLPELMEKYLQGYQQKYFVKFGVQHRSFNKPELDTDKVEIERLLKFVVENGDMTGQEAMMTKNNFKDNPEKLKELLLKATQKRIDRLMEMTWSDLDKSGLLAELKRKYLQGFKQKYKDQFGIDYIDK